MNEKTISSKVIFDGVIVKLVVQEVELPDGRRTTREVVHHPGAAAVVALTADQGVVMVRQYRKPIERVVLEIPAGKLDPGEDPLECIARELREETGYVARTIRPLMTYTPSPGFCDEVLHVYVAEDLELGDSSPDHDEFLEVDVLPLQDLLAMIDGGEITDGKTVTALLAYDRIKRLG